MPGLPAPRTYWPANPGSFRAYLLIDALLLGEAIALLFGDPQRTAGPAYAAINSLVSGGPQLFGVVLAACGIAMAVSATRWPRVCQVAMYGGAFGQMLLATGFAWAAAGDRRVGILAPITLTVLSLWILSNRAFYRTGR